MTMVDVDGSSHLSVDSQPKSAGLVWGFAATWRSVCIYHTNQVNSCSDHGHDDNTINIVVELLLLLLFKSSLAGWCRCGYVMRWHLAGLVDCIFCEAMPVMSQCLAYAVGCLLQANKQTNKRFTALK